MHRWGGLLRGRIDTLGRDQGSRVEGQYFQQNVFPLRQLDCLRASRDPASCPLYNEVLHPDNIVVALRISPGERLEMCPQLSIIKWPSQYAVCSHIERRYEIAGLSRAGNHKDRHLRHSASQGQAGCVAVILRMGPCQEQCGCNRSGPRSVPSSLPCSWLP